MELRLTGMLLIAEPVNFTETTEREHHSEIDAVYSLAEQAAADRGLPRKQQILAGREAVAVYKEGFSGWESAKLSIGYVRHGL